MHMFWVFKRTVLLGNHNICFGLEIRKNDFNYTILSGVPSMSQNHDNMQLCVTGTGLDKQKFSV